MTDRVSESRDLLELQSKEVVGDLMSFRESPPRKAVAAAVISQLVTRITRDRC